MLYTFLGKYFILIERLRITHSIRRIKYGHLSSALFTFRVLPLSCKVDLHNYQVNKFVYSLFPYVEVLCPSFDI